MRALPLLFLWSIACASGGVGNPNNNGGADAPVDLPKCGDKACAPSEIGKCTEDCGNPPPMAMCGNQTCEPPTENNSNCPGDCPTSANCDHDGMCEPPETSADCSDDCPAPPTTMCPPLPSFCKDCATGNLIACLALQVAWSIPNLDPAKCQVCAASGCTGQMANMMCEPAAFETPVTCVDCFE